MYFILSDDYGKFSILILSGISNKLSQGHWSYVILYKNVVIIVVCVCSHNHMERITSLHRLWSMMTYVWKCTWVSGYVLTCALFKFTWCYLSVWLRKIMRSLATNYASHRLFESIEDWIKLVCMRKLNCLRIANGAANVICSWPNVWNACENISNLLPMKWMLK